MVMNNRVIWEGYDPERAQFVRVVAQPEIGPGDVGPYEWLVAERRIKLDALRNYQWERFEDDAVGALIVAVGVHNAHLRGSDVKE